MLCKLSFSHVEPLLLLVNIKTLSRVSEYSLYNEELATYTEKDAFNHKDAEGFINITSLPHEVITRQTKNKMVALKS